MGILSGQRVLCGKIEINKNLVEGIKDLFKILHSFLSPSHYF